VKDVQGDVLGLGLRRRRRRYVHDEDVAGPNPVGGTGGSIIVAHQIIVDEAANTGAGPVLGEVGQGLVQTTAVRPFGYDEATNRNQDLRRRLNQR
jgi:hypothetical protein